MRVGLVSQCQPSIRWFGCKKGNSTQQPIFIISGIVRHTRCQGPERINLGKAREGLDFKRKMFFAFQSLSGVTDIHYLCALTYSDK